MLQVSGNTLQQVEKFKYQRVVFTSEGKQYKINTPIGKANAVVRELYRYLRTKLEFQTPQSCRLLDRFLLQSLSMTMNLG